MASITKILIANRGEIAVRIIKTAQRLGYRTVAVYSEADKDSLHVQLADEAVHIGPANVGESYLNQDKLLAAAKLTGADAVHPGYGFLSENAEFAQACMDHNLTFIGPSVQAITLMGSKRQSKLAMQAAGVPCIPGYEGDDQSNENLTIQAQSIGVPLMIKASAGGGGRGMRLVNTLEAIDEQLNSARSEAENAFGNGELILEKAIVNPRHIEIQIFGDQHGNIIYLGERDCSIQRRHQKVVEEAPSPAVNPDLRQAMGEAAVNAARSCQYVGAGTVEFLLAEDGHFYFLEMNTRLQVEHPVTEMITGFDLVEWQIDVAQGKPLPVAQQDVSLNGHAIEVRLYAEDPGNQFMPQTGPILKWITPDSPDTRIDHGIREGASVSAFYDPMLAKLIAWGKNRSDAARKLLRLIEDTHLLGVKTNKTFLANLIRHPAFLDGEATTHFIEEQFANDPSLSPLELPTRIAALASLILHHKNHNAWHSGHLLGRPCKWQTANETLEVELQSAGTGENRYQARVRRGDGGQQDESDTLQHEIELLTLEEHRVRYRFDGRCLTNHYLTDEQRILIADASEDWILTNQLHSPAASSAASGSGKIKAPMDGAVVAILCEETQQVTKGTTLAVIEAMKMEHPLKADMDGTIHKIHINEGNQVKGRQILIEISEDTPD